MTIYSPQSIFSNSIDDVLKYKDQYEDFLLEVIFRHKYGISTKCPSCGYESVFTRTSGSKSYQCHSCSHQLYPTAGTVFGKSTTSLVCWFYVIHLFITNNEKDIIISQIQKTIDTSHNTASTIYHRVKEGIKYGFLKELYFYNASNPLHVPDKATSAEVLPERKWLLSNEDFNDLAQLNDPNWSDWGLNVLWDNGITSPEDSLSRFSSVRFEYSLPDCTFCGAVEEHYPEGDDRWKCRKCRKSFSLTSQTYLDNTKLAYYHWHRFAYLIGEMKVTNSHVIANDLGLPQKTAWSMIETLREARKQETDYKFKNGQDILSFEHIFEVLCLLLTRTNKQLPVMEESPVAIVEEAPVNVTEESSKAIAVEMPEPITEVVVKPDVFEMLKENNNLTEITPTGSRSHSTSENLETTLQPLQLNEKDILTKELYNLIIGQQIISFKEKAYDWENNNSAWKGTYLYFTFDKIEFQIKIEVRIKSTTTSKGIIGEERYFVCHPLGLRMAQIKMWIQRINAHIISPAIPTEIVSIQTQPAIVIPTPADSDRKVCKTCKIPKPTSEFSPHVSTKDKLYSDCKVCNSEKAKNKRERKKRLETYISEPAPSQLSIKIPVSTITDQERKNNLKKFKEDNLKKFLNL